MEVGWLDIFQIDHLGLEPLFRSFLGKLLRKLGCRSCLWPEVDPDPTQRDGFFFGRRIGLKRLGRLCGGLRLANEVEDEEENCESDWHVGQHMQLKVKGLYLHPNEIFKDQNQIPT